MNTPDNQVDAVDELFVDFALGVQHVITRERYDEELSKAKAKLNALLLAARIDEVKRAKNRKQIFGYYDERIKELEKQSETAE